MYTIFASRQREFLRWGPIGGHDFTVKFIEYMERKNDAQGRRQPAI
jgi:hypothetical protein